MEFPSEVQPGSDTRGTPRRDPWGYLRYSDVVKVPSDEAPATRPDSPDELIWCLRMTVRKCRRVSHHLKYLLMNLGGDVRRRAELGWQPRGTQGKRRKSSGEEPAMVVG